MGESARILETLQTFGAASGTLSARELQALSVAIRSLEDSKRLEWLAENANFIVTKSRRKRPDGSVIKPTREAIDALRLGVE